MSDKVQTVGPFGGEGSLLWDDGAHSTVREIVVYVSLVIESIQVEYDDNGSSVLAEKHGYSEDGNKETVELDYPDEFLISVSGYLGGSNFPIRSLTFESNRRTYGPFGTQNGEYFKMQSSNGNKIIGFHGMSDYQVDGLGAYFELVGDDNSGELFGGKGGNSWDDGVHTTIRKLIVFYSEDGINSIEIEYDDNGKSRWSNRHGKRRGKKDSVELDYPDEFLISISGYTGANNFSTTVVRSITFESNRRTYGPFGTETGTPFKFPSTSSGSMIVGFHGRSGDNVDAIGAHLGPISSSSINPPSGSNVGPSPSPSRWITVGPYGGTGGSRWDDGVYDGVRQVIVFTSAVIESIQIEYEKNGQPKWSQIHGRGNGIRNIVTLDSPNEYLISVSGHIGLYYSMTVIRSLTLVTNRRTFGPFGTPDGQYNFNISSSNDIKVLGFFGSSGDYLDHIGAYLSTRAQATQWVSIGPYGGTGGNRWDDGVQTGVRQVVVFSSEVINSIQIEYDKNGQSKWSEIHGRERGTRNIIQLDYPNEYLVSVTGYIGLYYSMTVIRSLTLKSNRRTYGLFGTPNGTYDFAISSANTDKILGFFGSSGDCLDHIGAYVSKQVQVKQQAVLGT